MTILVAAIMVATPISSVLRNLLQVEAEAAVVAVAHLSPLTLVQLVNYVAKPVILRPNAFIALTSPIKVRLLICQLTLQLLKMQLI